MGKYQAYPEYKDSGVEWIGNYPSDWHLTRIKFESYVKARVGWHGLKSDDFTDEGPYLVTGSDFRGPVIQWENCYHCDLSRYEQDPYIQLKEGDLLITKDGTIGKVALVSGLDGLATLNSGVFVVRPLFNNYISRFYFWLLQSSVFTGFVDFNKTGSTIVHLYQDTFVNFKFAMPDFDTQEKIANFLDHETAKIDALIEKQQQLIQLLKEKRQAVISHAVTKGLNPNAPMKDSGIEWLGEVPAHWGVVGFKKYLESIVDYRGRTPEKVDTGIFLITARNIKKGTIDYEVSREFVAESDYLEIMRRGVPEIGDVLFTTEAPLGEVAQVDNTEVALAQRIIKFRAKKSHLINSYLKAYIQSPAFQQGLMIYATGSTALGIKSERLGYLTQLLPPISEQVDIVKHIENLESRYEHLMSVAQRQIDLMQERRTALISAAVTGKIDVRDFVVPA